MKNTHSIVENYIDQYLNWICSIDRNENKNSSVIDDKYIRDFIDRIFDHYTPYQMSFSNWLTGNVASYPEVTKKVNIDDLFDFKFKCETIRMMNELDETDYPHDHYHYKNNNWIDAFACVSIADKTNEELIKFIQNNV